MKNDKFLKINFKTMLTELTGEFDPQNAQLKTKHEDMFTDLKMGFGVDDLGNQQLNLLYIYSNLQ